MTLKEWAIMNVNSMMLLITGLSTNSVPKHQIRSKPMAIGLDLIWCVCFASAMRRLGYAICTSFWS